MDQNYNFVFILRDSILFLNTYLHFRWISRVSNFLRLITLLLNGSPTMTMMVVMMTTTRMMTTKTTSMMMMINVGGD